jgi:PAS domain-containing protein
VIDGKTETFYFDFTFQPLFNDDGVCEGVMSYATDVTAIERARLSELEALRQTELAKLQLELAISGANLGTWSSDLEEGVMRFSDALAKIFGCPGINSLPFADVMARIDPEYLPLIINIFP